MSSPSPSWFERQFSFYLSYHNNKINQLIHIICVWPILFTAQIMLSYTPNVLQDVQLFSVVPVQYKLNWAFAATIIYTVYYMLVEQPGIAGPIAASFTVLGYLFANKLSENPDNFNIALGIHVVCWIAQFYGHGAHEGRAPALLDNLLQAIFMAPLFVLMEVMFALGYKSDFKKKTLVVAQKAIAEFRGAQKRKE